MATYIGYNTVDQVKNYVLTDFDLIKRDLLNAFNIKQGEVPGRPNVGTTIWNFMFDNQGPELTQDLYNEIQRVVALDPRIYVGDVQVYVQDNGILIELEVDTIAGVEPSVLALLFDENTRRASYV
jgi:phage baseplate assembly protein W